MTLVSQINQRQTELDIHPALAEVLLDKSILRVMVKEILKSTVLQVKLAQNIFIEDFWGKYQRAQKLAKRKTSGQITQKALSLMQKPKPLQI